jgi:hypothetical protein
MKTLIRILLLGVLPTAVACAQVSVAAIQNDDDAAARAAALTRQYHLTSIATPCLYFDTDDQGRDYLVRVRERHSKACGGDPGTSPTVFFMRLRKSDGHATTTAYGIDGRFQALTPSGKSGRPRTP